MVSNITELECHPLHYIFSKGAIIVYSTENLNFYLCKVEF